MIEVNDLFAAIESQEFSAAVNVASDFKTFLRTLTGERPVQALAAARNDIPTRNAICARWPWQRTRGISGTSTLGMPLWRLTFGC